MLRFIGVLALVFATPASAQDDGGVFRIGDDVYSAGMSVDIATDGIDDVFAIGERVDLSAPIGGNAHLAGRRVNSDAVVGGDLYAAGADVTVREPVEGDATLTGYDINVLAEIGGDLRAGGANLRVVAPVGGTALVAGGNIEIDAAITGDAAIAADDLAFGPDARIDGRLALYGEDVDEIAVPAGVVSADRIDRVEVAPGERTVVAGREVPGVAALVSGFVVGVIVVTLLALLVASLAPEKLERAGVMVRERPFRTFWVGFLTLAAVIGSCVLLLLTLIGILLIPAVIVLAFVIGLLGYLAATYLVGRALWGWFGVLPPDGAFERLLTAGIGAVVVALVALFPYLGWLALLVLTLVGVGALAVGIFRPELKTR